VPGLKSSGFFLPDNLLLPLECLCRASEHFIFRCNHPSGDARFAMSNFSYMRKSDFQPSGKNRPFANHEHAFSSCRQRFSDLTVS
jgi:hypothetical protein